MTTENRTTGRLFLDGQDAALFLRQHGDMTNAVERMADATQKVVLSLGELHHRVGAVERGQEEILAHRGALDSLEHRQTATEARPAIRWSIGAVAWIFSIAIFASVLAIAGAHEFVFTH